jgi:hypothetical protein
MIGLSFRYRLDLGWQIRAQLDPAFQFGKRFGGMIQFRGLKLQQTRGREKIVALFEDGIQDLEYPCWGWMFPLDILFVETNIGFVVNFSSRISRTCIASNPNKIQQLDQLSFSNLVGPNHAFLKDPTSIEIQDGDFLMVRPHEMAEPEIAVHQVAVVHVSKDMNPISNDLASFGKGKLVLITGCLKTAQRLTLEQGHDGGHNIVSFRFQGILDGLSGHSPCQSPELVLKDGVGNPDRPYNNGKMLQGFVSLLLCGGFGVSTNQLSVLLEVALVFVGRNPRDLDDAMSLVVAGSDQFHGPSLSCVATRTVKVGGKHGSIDARSNPGKGIVVDPTIASGTLVVVQIDQRGSQCG